MPVVWTKFELPLGGVDTYTDAHHIAPGKLAELENARFDNPPGINKRYGYTALTTETYSPGTVSPPTTPTVGALTAASRIVDHKGELLLYQNSALLAFTLVGADQKWISRGLTPNPWLERDGVHADPLLSITTGDVAYNQGVTVVSSNSSYSVTVYDANGHTLSRETETTFRAGKVVAVGNFIYLFAVDGLGAFGWTRINVTSENYSFPALTTVASIDVETAAGRFLWDVCAVGAANWAVAYEDNSSNTVHVALFDVATNTQQDNEDTTESGLDAISVRGTMGEQVWVFYGQSTPRIRATAYAVTTTTLTQTLAPTSISTTALNIRNIASARLTSTLEAAIWTYINDASVPVTDMDDVGWRTITTAGTLGTARSLEDCTLLTRPWEDGSNGLFAAVAFNDLNGEQGTGYIIRWGQTLTGSVDATATWYGTFARAQTDIWLTYFLPNVISTPTLRRFPVAVKQRFINGGETDRTVIAKNVGATTSANNALDLVSVDYVSKGHFMTADWGRSAFIAGARPSWYDGAGVCEHGFAWYPTLSDADFNATGAGAGLDAGIYVGQLVYEFLDRNNMMHRSAPSFLATEDASAGVITGLDYVVRHDLTLTDRAATAGSAAAPQILPYRSAAGGSVAYRATSFSGFAVTNGTRSITAGTHGTDADIAQREVVYTTGEILDNAGTPPCKYTLRHQDRLWMAGMENPNTLWFSQPFVETEAPRFSEALILDIGERVTAIGSMDEKLVVFSESNVYQVIGQGPPASGGVDIGFAVDLVTGDTGCIEQRSVVETPRGVMFRGHKGFYLLTRGGELAYVGAAVQGIARQYTNTTSAVLLSLRNEVRFTVDDGEESRILHYNYFLDQWSVDVLPAIAIGACLTSNIYAWAKSNGQVYTESIGAFSDPDDAFIPLKVTTPWITMDTKQGWQRVRSLSLLGRSAGSHGLRVRIAYDYLSTWAQTITVTGPTLAALPLEQIKIRFARQKCQAFRVEIIDTLEDDNTAGLNLTSLVFEIGLKRGTVKLQAAAKR